MKNLMRILSVLLAFAAFAIIISTIFDTGVDFAKFSSTMLDICTTNILPIISISICAYCLERNDSNYIIRIIPIYMCIPILISIIMALFETNAEWLTELYSFLSSTFYGVTVLSIAMVIKPNNSITKIIKYIIYALLAINVIMAIYIQIKIKMVDQLPNVYGYQNYGGFGFSTVTETMEFAAKLYIVSIIGQLFSLILLFITNYAFSDKIEIESDVIDYEAVKTDALNIANAQMNSIYNRNEIKEEVIDRSASEKGLMNVNNQLGQNSNVGTVKEKAKETNISGSSLETLIPLANNPVENKTSEEIIEKKEVEQVIESTPQQNLDVQEQMKEKIRNEQINNQTINQPVQQTITQQISSQPINQVTPQQVLQQNPNQSQENQLQQQIPINQNNNQ